MSPPTTCPHCSSPNPPASAFCESCGKALPSPTPTPPRLLLNSELPTTSVGIELTTSELGKKTRRAANTLLVVGIIQLLVGAFLLTIFNQTKRPVPDAMTIIVVQFIVAFLFLALYLWARRSPLPASITGLVLYGTLVTLNVVKAISILNKHPTQNSNNGLGGVGIGWIDILILAFLIQGIGASLKHRRLSNTQPA
ncbi:MAG TPA: hypothetical protein VFE58_00575 [Tepidisphaeraceae bacterium]|nr:hypothetical protein [Tepidisphaeraceae bacterium]